MGSLVNPPLAERALRRLFAALIIALNVFLLVDLAL